MIIDFQHIQQLIADCKVDDAISALSEAIPALGGDTDGRARAFYLLGNAYGKLGNWRDAIHNYCWNSTPMALPPKLTAALAKFSISTITTSTTPNHLILNPYP